MCDPRESELLATIERLQGEHPHAYHHDVMMVARAEHERDAALAEVERLQGEKEVFSESFKRNLRKGTEEVRAERDAAQSQLSSLTEERDALRKALETIHKHTHPDLIGTTDGCNRAAWLAWHALHPDAAQSDSGALVERLKNG